MADANLGPTTAERLEGIVLRGAEAMFFAAAAEGRLVFGRCSSCDATMFPPRALCQECGGRDMRLESSRGRGTVVSETTIVMAPSAAFAEWAPYQVILVELEEGFTLMSNIVGETRAAIGNLVQVTFLEPSEGRAVPLFKVIQPDH